MCGRARLASDYSEIKIQFRIPLDTPSPNVPARWNMAPTQSCVIVRRDEAGARMLDATRWGLIPFWAKDAKIGYSTFNAQSETAETKPAFREAFKRRRCLVPVDGFYEWKKLDPKGKEKQPYSIALKDRSIMALAGLWESWKSPEGETIRSHTILTCPPNKIMATLHNRMPVILNPAAWPLWLGETPAGPDEIRELLAPCPSDRLDIWPVSPLVGNVKHDHAGLAAPLNSK